MKHREEYKKKTSQHGYASPIHEGQEGRQEGHEEGVGSLLLADVASDISLKHPNANSR